MKFIFLLLVLLPFSPLAKENFSANPKTHKLACLRLDHRIAVIRSKLRMGYTQVKGTRLKQQLEYYQQLQEYYKCNHK